MVSLELLHCSQHCSQNKLSNNVQLHIDYVTVMVGNYLGTYTKRHALGVHLSNLVIRSNTVPFKLSCSL